MCNLIIVLGIHLVQMQHDNSVLLLDIASVHIHNRVSSIQSTIFHELGYNAHNIRFADLMVKLGNGMCFQIHMT